MLRQIFATVFVNTYILLLFLLYSFSGYQIYYITVIEPSTISGIVFISFFTLIGRLFEIGSLIVAYREILKNKNFNCNIFLKNKENTYESLILQNKIKNTLNKNYVREVALFSLFCNLISYLITCIYFAINSSYITILLVGYCSFLFIMSIFVFLILLASN